MFCRGLLYLRNRGSVRLGIVPFHIFGMLLNLVAFVLTLRDLYLREFASENAKVTWALLITMTGGVGWLAYIFKHALKPRYRVDGSA